VLHDGDVFSILLVSQQEADDLNDVKAKVIVISLLVDVLFGFNECRSPF
jgi:hypothetical protein